MREHPFALITGCTSELQPVATQVPCFISQRNGQFVLTGHIMRQTDHHLAFEQNPNVLAVFTGPHTYVSASWYSDQQTASTWNYMSVHARGRMQFLDGAALLEVLQHTTDHFENDPHSPSNFDKLPEDYVAKLSKAIVAFEIVVSEIDHVFKLSQNKDRHSYEKIMTQLHQQGSDAQLIADEMAQRKNALYKDEQENAG